MLQVKLSTIVSFSEVYSTDEWMLKQICFDPSRVVNISVNNYRIYVFLDGRRDPIVIQYRCTLDANDVLDNVMDRINKILSNV